MTTESNQKSALSPTYAKVLFYVALLLLMAIALYPMHDILPESALIHDKLDHFAAFCVLSWLIQRAYGEKNLFVKVSVLVVYGALIEAAQFFVPYRVVSFLDLLADCAGILFAFCMMALFGRISGTVKK